MGHFIQKPMWADIVDSSTECFVARHQYKGNPLLRLEGNN